MIDRFGLIAGLRRLFQRFRNDERGSAAIMMGISLAATTMMLGLVVQSATDYRIQRALQTSTTMAALAGAQDINCCTTSGTAITTAKSYSALNPIKGQTVTMAAGYPVLKCFSSTGVSCGAPDNANAIVVKQQVNVPLIFGKLFGQTSVTISATATAGAKGAGGPLDLMIILDTTASMNSSDSSCSIAGATRLVCATAGARSLLQGLAPSQVQVGLMVFPGLTNTSQVPYEYDCSSSSTPSIARYSASPVYQVIGLTNDYKASDSATSLNTSSNLVRALKGGPNGCQQGIVAVGGVGTYYAGVIAAAQTALTTYGRSGVQKAIIFLSDGDASASSSNVPSGKSTNQCHQGITAAAAATAAGTWVYTAAYGASTYSSSSCSTDTSSPISACAAMQQMASTPAMFFSDTTGGTSACTSAANPSSELVTLFKNIGTALTSPRLLPNGTT